MTPETVKEKLCVYRLSLLAAREGLKIFHHDRDDGVDLGIAKSIVFHENGSVTQIPAGRMVEFQCKTTTTSRIQADGKTVKFDLDDKTFRRLVWRRKARLADDSHAPLVLVLLVLPPNPEESPVRQGCLARRFRPNSRE